MTLLRWFNGVLQVYAPSNPEASAYEWVDVPTVTTHGESKVETKQGWVETTLPDGSIATGVPMHREEDIARAHALGYDDVWAMTKEHDRFHAMLADFLGLAESPVLRHSVLGNEGNEITWAEETAVLAIQRFLNLCRKAGLVK